MIAISLLFAFAALFAVSCLALGWRPYARRIASVRQELAACPETRELRFRVVAFGVPSGGATVHVLPVRRRTMAVPLQGLRAAA